MYKVFDYFCLVRHHGHCYDVHFARPDNYQSSPKKSLFFQIFRQNCLLLEPGTKFGSNLMTRDNNASFSERKCGADVMISDSGNQLTNISLKIHNG